MATKKKTTKKEVSEKKEVQVTPKAVTNYCVLMISPNKPRKFVVTHDFEEMKLIMANAREKDKFVEFMIFERVYPIENGKGNILKGLPASA